METLANLAKLFWERITRRMKSRDKTVALFLILCAGVTVLAFREKVSFTEILFVGFWILLLSWYFAVVTRKNRKWYLSFALVLTAIWTGAAAFLYWSPPEHAKDIRSLMKSAQLLRSDGQLEKSAASFEDALKISK